MSTNKTSVSETWSKNLMVGGGGGGGGGGLIGMEEEGSSEQNKNYICLMITLFVIVFLYFQTKLRMP